MILTHTRDEVSRAQCTRPRSPARHHELGIEYKVETSRGDRLFASGDRVMFLRNERSLSVRNGSLGTIDSMSATRMAVLMDDGRAVAFDIKDYADIDHGYAATIHKSQGVTVDRIPTCSPPPASTATPAMSRCPAIVTASTCIMVKRRLR